MNRALSAASEGTTRVGLVSALANLFSRLVGRGKAGPRGMRLAELDDHLLEDAGVSRREVMSALSWRLSRDPSFEIRRIALSRGQRQPSERKR